MWTTLFVLAFLGVFSYIGSREQIGPFMVIWPLYQGAWQVIRFGLRAGLVISRILVLVIWPLCWLVGAPFRWVDRTKVVRMAR